LGGTLININANRVLMQSQAEFQPYDLAPNEKPLANISIPAVCV